MTIQHHYESHETCQKRSGEVLECKINQMNLLNYCKTLWQNKMKVNFPKRYPVHTFHKKLFTSFTHFRSTVACICKTRHMQIKFQFLHERFILILLSINKIS